MSYSAGEKKDKLLPQATDKSYGPVSIPQPSSSLPNSRQARARRRLRLRRVVSKQRSVQSSRAPHPLRAGPRPGAVEALRRTIRTRYPPLSAPARDAHPPDRHAVHVDRHGDVDDVPAGPAVVVVLTGLDAGAHEQGKVQQQEQAHKRQQGARGGGEAVRGRGRAGLRVARRGGRVAAGVVVGVEVAEADEGAEHGGGEAREQPDQEVQRDVRARDDAAAPRGPREGQGEELSCEPEKGETSLEGAVSMCSWTWRLGAMRDVRGRRVRPGRGRPGTTGWL